MIAACLVGAVLAGCEIVGPGTELDGPAPPGQIVDTVPAERLGPPSGPFHATSIGVGAPFALKGSAWGALSTEGDGLVVSVDSLRLWRDPSAGRDGGPRSVGWIDVGLGSGSLALSWTVTARSQRRPVGEVLDLDESTWLRDLVFEIPLPPGTSDSDLADGWLVFAAYSPDRRSASYFHSRVRFSGRPASSLAGLPTDYRDGLARVFELEEVVGGRSISIVSQGEIHTAVRRQAAARGIPVCAYDSPDATAYPAFRIRGLVPRTADAFAARVSHFDADGRFGAAITVGLVRARDGRWSASVEEHVSAPRNVPRPEGRSFCHGGDGDP